MWGRGGGGGVVVQEYATMHACIVYILVLFSCISVVLRFNCLILIWIQLFTWMHPNPRSGSGSKLFVMLNFRIVHYSNLKHKFCLNYCKSFFCHCFSPFLIFKPRWIQIRIHDFDGSGSG